MTTFNDRPMGLVGMSIRLYVLPTLSSLSPLDACVCLLGASGQFENTSQAISYWTGLGNLNGTRLIVVSESR